MLSDYSKGFGGKFGVQADRQDKSAVGWDHHEAPQKHESQLDHKKGFGGKFGVQTDRMDKSAASFNEEPEKVGTNYSKVKPDIGSAKPSDLRAKFERMGSSDGSKPPSLTSSPAPKKNIQNIQAKSAMFENKPADVTSSSNVEKPVPKQLDQSKMVFLAQKTETETGTVEAKPKQLDQNKLAQFSQPKNVVEKSQYNNQIQEELEKLKQAPPQEDEEQIYENCQELSVETVPKVSKLCLNINLFNYV